MKQLQRNKRFTVDALGVIVSSLLSSIVDTVGNTDGSASTSSWFKITPSTSEVEIDDHFMLN